MRHSFLTCCCLLALIATTSCGNGAVDIESFTPRVRKNPSEADRFFNRGLAFSLLERETEAAEAFEEAVRLDPDDTEARFYLGVEYDILGNLERAKAAFTKALEGGPVETTHFRRGTAYFTVERYEEAAEEFEQALADNEPHPATILNKLGTAYMARERFLEAIGAFRKALAVNHDIAARVYNTYYYIGTAYQMLERYPEAIEAYKRAIAFRPDIPYSYYNLALVHLSRDDIDGAMKMYGELKERNESLAAALLQAMETYRNNAN